LKGDYSELQSPHSDFEASVRAGQEKVISDPFGHASEAARPWLPILNFFPGFPVCREDVQALEETKKEPKTWKERFYAQHLDVLLEQRFQWPREILMFQDRNPHISRSDFLHVLRRFDLACLKEICRLYELEQGGTKRLARATLVTRIVGAFAEGTITDFDKILDSVKERKARIKGQCTFDP